MSINYACGKLSMGLNTHAIPVEMFALNRKRLCERLKSKDVGKAIVMIAGGEEVPFYDTDMPYNVFRQESYFMWTFGVLEPRCLGALWVQNGYTVLFVPKLPENYAVWMGPLLTLEDYKNKYHVDEVCYLDKVANVICQTCPEKILTLKGKNTDSGLTSKEAYFEGIGKFRVDNSTLFNEIADLRVVKTHMELDVMKYVIGVSSAAHRKVMRMAKAGKSEYQCEASFMHHCYSEGGCRFVSYTSICGSGPTGAVLHYGHAGAPNDRVIQAGDMCLFDMGANYFGYCADITCSFPENGKFTNDQKLIYHAVLEANQVVFETCAPGVSWLNLHNLALKALLQYLKHGCLLKGNIDDMISAGLGCIFMPHGLGHLIGLDVHDVGGYLAGEPPRPNEDDSRKLRTARVLKKGMCLTIEPGCYFIDSLLDKAMSDPVLSKFLNVYVINRFRGTGGIRIEDDVYITDNGCVNMTKVPRTVRDIEDWMAGIGNDEKYR